MKTKTERYYNQEDKYKVYQSNGISYCVNYKGQKIKPYRSNYIQYKKETLLQKIINCILCR